MRIKQLDSAGSWELRIASAAMPRITKLGMYLIVLRPSLDVFRGVHMAGVSVTDLFAILLLGLVTVGLLYNQMILLPTGGVLPLLIGFGYWTLLSSFIAGFRYGVSGLPSSELRVVGLAAVAVVAANAWHTEPAWSLKAIALSTGVPCLIACFQTITGTGGKPSQYSVAESAIPRAYGTLSHSNAMAILAGMGALICAVCAQGRSTPPSARAWKGWYLLLSVNLVALIGTYTRGAWLAFAIALIVVLRSSGKKIFAVLGLLVLGALAISLNVFEIGTRISGDSSVSFRQVLWGKLLGSLHGLDWILGIGAGNVDNRVRTASIEAHLTVVDQVHNDYLRLIIASGIVGLAVYLGALYCVWRCANNAREAAIDTTRNAALATRGVLVFVGIVSLTDNVFQELVLQNVLWAMAGFCIAANSASRSARAQVERVL